jgi:hypothetical protein
MILKMWKSILLIASAGAMLWAGIAAENASDKSHKLTSVSIRKMADSLHAVIAADRQSYSELIVQRLATDEQRLAATENWREKHGLPVHAQMLRHSADRIQTQGAEFSYTLRSLWPINPGSGPQTQAEQAGLEAVAKKPGEPFYTEEELGGRSYFTAVYADRATLSSCVSCHNQHPHSPKKDFKEGDVMGAIVVRVPLEF